MENRAGRNAVSLPTGEVNFMSVDSEWSAGGTFFGGGDVCCGLAGKVWGSQRDCSGWGRAGRNKGIIHVFSMSVFQRHSNLFGAVGIECLNR
jgi:hypothetical protein